MKTILLCFALLSFCGVAVCMPSGHSLLLEGNGGVVQTSGADLTDMSFSWEMWVNMSSLPREHEMQWVFMHGGPCGMDRCLFFGFDHEARAIFGFILDDMYTGATFAGDVGTFVHWAGTYDRFTGQRIIYRNGELVAADVSTAAYQPHSSDLFIGRDNVGNNMFRGMVDDFRLWSDVALPQETIVQFMGAKDLSVHPFTQHLLVHYTFDEPGQALFDHGPHHIVAWLHDTPVDSAFAEILPEDLLSSNDLADLAMPSSFVTVLKERITSTWVLVALVIVILLAVGKRMPLRRSSSYGKKFDDLCSLESGNYSPRSESHSRSGSSSPPMERMVMAGSSLFRKTAGTTRRVALA